jgi:hypothetical protein
VPLVANVLFEFDKDRSRDIRTYSLESLDRSLARIGEKAELVHVELVGHADRMDGRGHDYNRGLSERRAQTVRELLIGRGVDPAKIGGYSYAATASRYRPARASSRVPRRWNACCRTAASRCVSRSRADGATGRAWRACPAACVMVGSTGEPTQAPSAAGRHAGAASTAAAAGLAGKRAHRR